MTQTSSESLSPFRDEFQTDAHCPTMIVLAEEPTQYTKNLRMTDGVCDLERAFEAVH